MEIAEAGQKEQLALQQGKAYSAAVDFMKTQVKYSEQVIDDYIVTVMVEEAEGHYMISSNELEWHVPDNQDNLHIEVIVRDRETEMFIPNLQVRLTVLDQDENVIGDKEQPFIWHPYMYHYGTNWYLPESGDYLVEIRIKCPKFHRHDEIKGKRYQKDVILRLGPIVMKTGRKPHGPE